MQWRELDPTRNGSGSTLASSPVRNGIARRHRRAPGVRASRPPGSKCRRYPRVRPKTRRDVPNQHIFRRQSRSHPYIQQYHCSPANHERSAPKRKATRIASRVGRDCAKRSCSSVSPAASFSRTNSTVICFPLRRLPHNHLRIGNEQLGIRRDVHLIHSLNG